MLPFVENQRLEPLKVFALKSIVLIYDRLIA